MLVGMGDLDNEWGLSKHPSSISGVIRSHIHFSVRTRSLKFIHQGSNERDGIHCLPRENHKSIWVKDGISLPARSSPHLLPRLDLGCLSSPFRVPDFGCPCFGAATWWWRHLSWAGRGEHPLHHVRDQEVQPNVLGASKSPSNLLVPAGSHISWSEKIRLPLSQDHKTLRTLLLARRLNLYALQLQRSCTLPVLYSALLNTLCKFSASLWAVSARSVAHRQRVQAHSCRRVAH